MNDLHEQIRIAIEARIGRAQVIIDGWDHVGVATSGIPPFIAPQAVATFIVAENPTVALRHCAEDLDVLDRHVHKGHYASIRWCASDSQQLPCPDIRSLARRYGIKASGTEAQAVDHG